MLTAQVPMPYYTFLFLLLVCLNCSHSPAPDSIKSAPATMVSDSLQLQYIRSTGRISSNHFSDMVLDTKGNAYIASFAKKEGPVDHISITKIAPDGKLLWELGSGVQGRACAISIDSMERIWVVGNYFRTMRLGDKILAGGQAATIFIAVIDAKGQVLKLIGGNRGSLSFDVHVNTKQEVLISGTGDGSFGLDAQPIYGARSFLAKFSPDLKWEWTLPVEMNIHRIRSDEKGNFLVAGSFYESLTLGGKTYKTNGSFDRDGVLLNISPDKTLNWITAFGNPGFVRKGYRTMEAIQDFVSLPNGHLLATAVKESPAPITPNRSAYTYTLVEFDTLGQVIRQVPFVEYIASKPGVSVLTRTADHKVWATAVAKGPSRIGGQTFDFIDHQSILAVFPDSGLEKPEVHLPVHGNNMLFRAGFANGNDIAFPGISNRICNWARTPWLMTASMRSFFCGTEQQPDGDYFKY